MKYIKELNNSIFATATYGDHSNVYFRIAEGRRIYLGVIDAGDDYLYRPTPRSQPDRCIYVPWLLQWIESLDSLRHGLVLASDPLYSFTDVEPGEKCFDGGEYGFYTNLSSLGDGVYLVTTYCTCEFDACGCGMEGIALLTEDEARSIPDYNRFDSKASQLRETLAGSGRWFDL